MNKLTIIPMVMLAGISVSQAATTALALYTAGPADGPVVTDFINTEFNSVDTEPLTTAGQLVNGGGITAGAAGLVITNTIFDSSTSGSAGYNFASVTTADRTAAIAAGDFFSLTVATNGNSVTFEEISFFQNQFRTTAKYDLTYTVGVTETALLTGVTPLASNAAVALETVDFADFTTTSDVTFTFYLYGASNVNHGTRFDDITVSGCVAPVVPEPSATALLGFGILGLLARRKK